MVAARFCAGHPEVGLSGWGTGRMTPLDGSKRRDQNGVSTEKGRFPITSNVGNSVFRPPWYLWWKLGEPVRSMGPRFLGRFVGPVAI